MNVQTNYCNSNLLIVDVMQLNKIVKMYYFQTLKSLWGGQGKIKMHYGVSKVKKQLSGKSFNVNCPPNQVVISDPPKTLSRAPVELFKIAC